MILQMTITIWIFCIGNFCKFFATKSVTYNLKIEQKFYMYLEDLESYDFADDDNDLDILR